MKQIKFRVEEYIIPDIFISYLFNADSSGLEFYNPGYSKLFDQWLESLDNKIGHWSSEPDSQTLEFSEHDMMHLLPYRMNCERVYWNTKEDHNE